MTDVLTEEVLTNEERLAELTPEQLRQLIGLVDYDAAADVFPVTGWDAVVWVVGNAVQTARHYQSAYGMQLVAYTGPETGKRDHQGFVLTSGACRFVILGGVAPGQRIPRPSSSPRGRRAGHQSGGARRRPLRGDTPGGWVPRSWSSRTTTPMSTAPCGSPRWPPTATPGTRWSIGRAYHGLYLPGYVERSSTHTPRHGRPKRLFQALDHVVGNVELGRMDEWVGFYRRVMGFTNMAEFVGDDIATEYSALMSKVVASGNHRVKFPLNEPAVGKKRSQIDEFLEFYDGPGAQHLALATNDILTAVDVLRAEGVDFLATPDSYYTDPELRARIGEVRVPIEELAPPRHPGRPRRGRLPAADLHPPDRRPTDGVLRADRAARLARLRQGQLQGPVRGHRARAGAPRQPVVGAAGQGAGPYIDSPRVRHPHRVASRTTRPPRRAQRLVSRSGERHSGALLGRLAVVSQHPEERATWGSAPSTPAPVRPAPVRAASVRPTPQQNPYDQPSQGQGPYQQPPYPPQPYGQPPYSGGYPAVGAKQALTADGVPLSGWWWRVLAMLIDDLIVGIVAALLSSPDLRPVVRPVRRVLHRDRTRPREAGQPPPPQPLLTDLVSYDGSADLVR